ncbi:MAG: tetratricopeptide repeat protein [Deltaproteobacteria bacterium]|nr:tetratricopeptide repeat protein [Deltaproteobacteria bacterium]
MRCLDCRILLAALGGLPSASAAAQPAEAPGADRAVATAEPGAAGAGTAEAPPPTGDEAYETLVARIPADAEPCLTTYLRSRIAAGTGRHEESVRGLRDALEQALAEPNERSRLVALAAIGQLHGVLGWAPGAWVAPAAELLDHVPLPATSWLTVRHRLLQLEADLRLDVVDRDGADATAADRGCLLEWTGTGPEGPTGTWDWDRDPPDGHLLHPAAWGEPQNEPSRPERSWKPETYLCRLTLGRRDEGRPGVHRIAAVVELPENLRTALLHVRSGDPFLVRIDGTVVARNDPARQATGDTFDWELTAPAGRHRLELQVGSSWGRPTLSVGLLGLDDDGRAVPLRSSGDLAVETPPAFLGSLRELALPEPGDWAHALPVLDLLELHGREESATRLAERLADAPGGADEPFLQLRAAFAAMRDPMLALPEARRRAAARFDALGPLAEGLVAVHSTRALWALQDGDLDDAIELLRAALERFPGEPELLQQLQGAYSQRGWTEESRRTVEAIEAALPESCAVKRMRLSLAYDVGDAAEIDRAVEDYVACKPRAFDRMNRREAQWRWDDVAAEIDRLEPLYDDPHAPEVARAMLRLQQGDTTGLEALLRERLAEEPTNGGWVESLASLLLREGRVDEARALWLEHADRTGSSAALERAAALDDIDLHAALFIPAALAIASYEARRGEQEAPATQILDHTVSRIHDDGAITMRTHTILKLSSQEAIERYGQSGGGGNLVSRTIAPDGGVTNVLQLAEAGVGSFPNLTPGCYIETFSSRVDEPSALLQGGTDHWRFYFQSADETMARTEFVVVSPPDDPLELSPRADPPAEQHRDLGALHLRRWTARDVEPLRVEPYSVQSDAYVPSVRVARDFDWHRMLVGLADALYGADYVPLEVLDFARETCDGLDESACARTLYDWILDTIESGDFGESLAATYQRRAGSRSRLLVALLRANGFHPRLLLATSLDRDRTETTVAEAGRFYYPVVEVGGTYLTIEHDEAPFGFLPAEIRGMPAAPFDPLGDVFETVRLPERPDLQEGVLADLDLEVEPDGGDVRVAGSMTFVGGFAADLRDGLLQRSPADREGDLTGAFISPSFPGAEVESVAVEGLEDRETPLVVRFVASAAGMAVRRGGTLLLPPIIPQMLSRGYAPLPRIEHPAVAFPPIRVELRIRLHVPDWRPAATPGLDIDAAGVTFDQRVEPADDGGTLVRHLSIAHARLEPDAYPAFAEAIRRAENLWNLPLELRRDR